MVHAARGKLETLPPNEPGPESVFSARKHDARRTQRGHLGLGRRLAALEHPTHGNSLRGDGKVTPLFNEVV